jgi:hypothetical protein
MPLGPQGGDVTVDALVRNGAGAPVDATSLTIEIRTTAMVLVDGPHLVPPIVHLDLGHYEYTWAIPALQTLGTYNVTWTGIDPTTLESLYGYDTIEVVPPGYIQTGLYFLAQADYEDVRRLIGVTDLDVSDETIQALPFGQHAELRVRTAVPTWADITIGGEPWNYLRTAVAYGTAALIAESYAKGGMVSLAHGPGTGGRTAKDWDDLAKVLWGYFPKLVIAATGPPPQEIPMMYDFQLLRASGPRSARLRGEETYAWATSPPFGPGNEYLDVHQAGWSLFWDPIWLAGQLPRS